MQPDAGRLCDRPDQLCPPFIRTRPIWVLMAAFVLATGSVVFVEPAPYELLIVSVAGLCFALGLSIPQVIRIPALLVGVLLVANLISVFPAQRPDIAVPYVLVTVYLWLTTFFFACLVYENPRHSLPILWIGYGVAALVAGMLGYAGYFQLVPFHELLTTAGRAQGLFKDPNVYGPFLYPAIFVCLVALERAKPLQALFLLGIIAFLLGALFVGFSRASWAACILGLMLLAVLRFLAYRTAWEKTRLLLAALGLFAFFTVLFAALLSKPEVRDMFMLRAQILQDYDTEAGGRFWVQRQALEMSLVQPLGIGPAHTPIVFEREPHNVYIFTLIENGWLAAAAFLAFVGLTLIRGLRVCFLSSPIQGLYTATYVSLVAMLANSMVIDSIHWRHLFVLFGLVWGVILAAETRARVGSTVYRPTDGLRQDGKDPQRSEILLN